MTNVVRASVVAALFAATSSAFAARAGLDTFICHRGESFDAPENTLPAYRLAVERGFGFECDLYLSKDGRCFTFHDSDLTRTTGGANTNRCSDVTWDELSRLDVGGWGKWKGSRFVGTRPALVEEVLELARDGRRIYIELKTGPEIVPAVAKALEAQKRANGGNVCFISFNSATCAAVKRRLPDYPVYWLSGGGSNGKAISAEEIIRSVKACGADGVDIYFNPSVHTAEFVRKVKAAGLGFHVWTVDNAEKSCCAFARGVQTVTTNCARRQMDEIGGWTGWKGRRVAFLGDSITDERHIGCTTNYWGFLQRDLGIEPLVYGINGHQMSGLVGQAQMLKAEHPDDVDALVVFAGTNDYNSNVPLGTWYDESDATVNRNGRMVQVRQRKFSLDGATFRGRINLLLKYLHENFVGTPIYLMTPIHRGYATFGARNVQPDESYSNEKGLFVDAYVKVVREAADVWAVTLVDTYAECGLMPSLSGHSRFFHNAKTDNLHPNAAGHERIARVLGSKMLLP